METVLVTGGCGFIGSHIANELHNKGYNVCVVDDMSGCKFVSNISHLHFCDTENAILDLDKPGIHVYQGDCANSKDMELLCKLTKPDILVHCAANAREGASQFQPMAVTHKGLSAYVNTLVPFLKHGGSKVICFSSMAVYGEGREAPPFHESMEPKPEDVYAVNKYAMEEVTKIMAGVHGFSYVILRPHNVIGEKQALCDRFRNVVGIFMNLIMRGEEITIFGDGEQTRAFSYIGDSLPAFIHAIERCEELSGEIINVGGTQPVTVNELTAIVKVAMDAPDYPVVNLPDRLCEVKHAHCSFDKSIALLNYAEAVGWREGVFKMAEWALKRGPQEWVNNDPLELITDATPKPWLQ
jgi:UDP-glucose 4-epimerase